MNKTEIEKIPQTENIINDPRVAEWPEKISRNLTIAAVKSAVEFSREKIKEGQSYNEALLYSNIIKLCERLYRRRVRPVINATGVIIHTKMGRSPILPEVWDQCAPVNTGYSNLEFSLATGKRSRRNGLIPYFINILTEAESCTVVNNNAAAVLLVLSVLAADKEVIISRSEQVQIGGAFRISEILKLSGAKLVEVGTTNITNLNDYLDAITENTAMILRVNRSNFSIRGFTSEPSIKELASAIPDNILLVSDQGSGVLNENLTGELKVKNIISDGADLVTFSGDKIIGGPQAGIIAGKGGLISLIEKHPLTRTMQPGKTIYSLLEATLLHRINSLSAVSRHVETVENSDDIKDKCKKLKRGISTDIFKLAPDRISLGDGSAPDSFFDSWSIQIISEKMNAQSIIKLLRENEIPIIGTVKDDTAVLNPANLTEDEIKYVKSVLKQYEELF